MEENSGPSGPSQYLIFFLFQRQELITVFLILTHFSVNRYRMFRRVGNYFGGGLCLYAKDGNASKQLNSHKENINKPKQFPIFRNSVK